MIHQRYKHAADPQSALGCDTPKPKVMANGFDHPFLKAWEKNREKRQYWHIRYPPKGGLQLATRGYELKRYGGSVSFHPDGKRELPTAMYGTASCRERPNSEQGPSSVSFW